MRSWFTSIVAISVTFSLSIGSWISFDTAVLGSQTVAARSSNVPFVSLSSKVPADGASRSDRNISVEQDRRITEKRESIQEYQSSHKSLIPVVQTWHDSDVTSLAFSHDGKMIASGASNIKLWDISSRKLITTLDTYGGIKYLAFSPDDKFLASTDFWTGDITLWNNNTGGIIKTFQSYGVNYRTNGFSPDSKYLALPLQHLDDKNISFALVETSTGNVKKSFKINDVNAVTCPVFSPDGNFIAISSYYKSIFDVFLLEISTGKTIRKFRGPNSRIESLAFSPSGSYIAASSLDGIVTLWDVSTGQCIKTFETLEGDYSGLHFVGFAGNGRYLVFPSRHIRGGMSFVMVEIPTGEVVRRFSQLSEGLAISSDGKYVAIASSSMKGDIITIYSLETGEQTAKIEGDTKAISFCFSPQEKYIISACAFKKGIADWEDSVIVDIIDVLTGSSKKTFIETNLSLEQWAFSPNEQYLAYVAEDRIELWALPSMRLSRVLAQGHDFYCHADCVFSPNGRYLAVPNINIEIWDVLSGELTRSIHESGTVTIEAPGFPPIIKALGLSSDGRYIASLVDEWGDKGDSWHVVAGFKIKQVDKGKVVVREISTSDVVSLFDCQLPDHYSTSGLQLFFSPDNKYLALCPRMNPSSGFVKIEEGRWRRDSWRRPISIWETSTGKPIEKVSGDQEVFSSEVKYDVSRSNDSGSFKIYRAGSQSPLSSIYQFRDGFLCLTPEGFFAGRGDFDNNIHFAKGIQVYEFNQFWDVFYRPDLVEKKLQGEDISKYTGGLTLEKAIRQPPPLVEILLPETQGSQRDVSVKVIIKDTGGGIGDIRLYHNGKLIQSSGVYRLAREEEVKEPVKVALAETQGNYRMMRGATLRNILISPKKTEMKDFTPLTGTIERNYKVTLVDGENTIAASAFNGQNTVMSAMKEVKVKAMFPGQKSRLFVLAIGNAHFKDPNQPLNMAIKDASDIAELMQNRASSIYQKAYIKVLKDARKEDIFMAFSELSGIMRPEDVFILFVASHGLADDDVYYLFTSEFDGTLKNEDMISSIELMELSKQTPALRQVFILDTCHAGAIIPTVAGLYDSRVSVMAKAQGMHIFAGSKSYQAASDSYKGNGLFTFCMLEGLGGPADKDSNRKVTIYEMGSYLPEKVKDASGGTQEPYIRTFGEDFAITVVDKPSK
jgi:WD40 repeat protein